MEYEYELGFIKIKYLGDGFFKFTARPPYDLYWIAAFQDMEKFVDEFGRFLRDNQKERPELVEWSASSSVSGGCQPKNIPGFWQELYTGLYYRSRDTTWAGHGRYPNAGARGFSEEEAKKYSHG